MEYNSISLSVIPGTTSVNLKRDLNGELENLNKSIVSINVYFNINRNKIRSHDFLLKFPKMY